MTNFKSKIVKSKLIRQIVEPKGKIINIANKCVYCSKCSKLCPVAAITVDRTSKVWTIDYDTCIRCQKCVKNCPTDALLLQK